MTKGIGVVGGVYVSSNYLEYMEL